MLADILEWMQLETDASARIEAFCGRSGLAGNAQVLDILSAAACGLGSWSAAGCWLTSPLPDARHAPLDLFSHEPAAIRAFRFGILEELYRMDTIRRVLVRC